METTLFLSIKTIHQPTKTINTKTKTINTKTKAINIKIQAINVKAPTLNIVTTAINTPTNSNFFQSIILILKSINNNLPQILIFILTIAILSTTTNNKHTQSNYTKNTYP